MTNDAQLNQIVIIAAQLTRDMPNNASDLDISRKIQLAIRIHTIMNDVYNPNTSVLAHNPSKENE